MSKKQFFTKIDQLRWWRTRQRYARFFWKSFLASASIALLCWLSDMPLSAHYALRASLVCFGIMASIILSQSFELNEEVCDYDTDDSEN